MTQSHKGSIIPIKNRVLSVDNHTTALFHYDLGPEDILNGITPIGYEKVLHFDGTGGKAYISDNTKDAPQLQVQTNLTLEGWVNLDNIHSNGDRTCIMIGTYYLTIDGNRKVACYWYGKNPAGYHASINSVPLNQWTHIAGVWDATTLKIYINGELDNTISTTGTGNPSAGLEVGEEGANRRARGSFRDLKIWRKALTQEELKLSMINKINNENLVGWWKLNDGEGSLARDSSAYSTDLIISNPIWSNGGVVYTLKSQEGKFGGGIAIEEGTTNYWAGWDSGLWYTYQGASDFKNTEITRPDRDTSCKVTGTLAGTTAGDYSGIKSDITSWSGPASGTFTASFWLYLKEPPPHGMNGYCKIYYSDGTDGAYGFSYNSEKANEWQFIERTFTTDSAKTISRVLTYIYTYKRATTTSETHSTIYYVGDIQLEQKSFATSFVNGSRPQNKLHYPISLIDPNEGTISFWTKIYAAAPNNNRLFDVIESGNRISISWSNNQIMFYSSGETPYAIQGGSVGLKEWIHIVATWSKTANERKLFINGVRIGTGTYIGPTGDILNNAFSIGDYIATTNNSWTANAVFDELRIDSIARTDDEILAWYESNSPFWPRGIYRKSY